MHKRFWMYLEMELLDLLPKFEQAFQVDNLYHDYENVWEWIESRDKKSPVYLNISRSHDWEKGNYKEPISISIESNTEEPVIVDEMGLKLKKVFCTTIYYGDLWIEKDDSIYTKLEKKFE